MAHPVSHKFLCHTATKCSIFTLSVNTTFLYVVWSDNVSSIAIWFPSINKQDTKLHNIYSLHFSFNLLRYLHEYLVRPILYDKIGLKIKGILPVIVFEKLQHMNYIRMVLTLVIGFDFLKYTTSGMAWNLIDDFYSVLQVSQHINARFDGRICSLT